MRKRTDPNRASWSEQLKNLLDELAEIPPGPQHDVAAHLVQQLRAAIHMEGWLRSPGLRRPD